MIELRTPAEIEQMRVRLERSFAPARGKRRAPHHRVRPHERHAPARQEIAPVGPVVLHRLERRVEVPPFGWRLVAVPQQVMADEQRYWNTEFATPGKHGGEIVLGAEPRVEDERQPVLLPPMPDDQLCDAQRRVGHLFGNLGDAVEATVGGVGVTHRRPHAADSQRLANMLGRIVFVGLARELREGARTGVPVAGKHQHDEVAALPRLARLDQGFV